MSGAGVLWYVDRMANGAGRIVRIPAPLARRVQGAARREARSVPILVIRALQEYLERKDEAEFLRVFRRAALRRGIRTQADVARLVDKGRERV